MGKVKDNLDVSQLSREERDKLMALLKEKKKEKDAKDKREQKPADDDTTKLQWMYQSKPKAANPEEYLLGKTVDKEFFRNKEEEEREQELEREQRRLQEQAVAIERHVQYDMQAKMREDPLFLMKKQELDARQRIMANPTQRKCLLVAQRLLEQRPRTGMADVVGKNPLEDASIPKKKQKRKLADFSDSESESSESDETDEESERLLKEYLKVRSTAEGLLGTGKPSGSNAASVKSERPVGKTSSRTFSVKTSKKPTEEAPSTKRHKHHKSESSRHDKHEHKHSKERSHRDKSPKGGKEKKREKEKERKKEKKKEKKEKKKSRKDDSDNDSDSDKPEKSTTSKNSNYGLIHTSNSLNNQSDSRVELQRRVVTESKKRPPEDYKKRYVVDKEKALAQMMSNANWRESQRAKNVDRFNHEDREEEAQISKNLMDVEERDYLNKMISTHADKLSLSERISRNKFSIQRTKAALDKKLTSH